MKPERTIYVLGANSFSGQDLVDLLLDDPANRVVGVSRSPERSKVFLKYKRRGDLSRFRYERIDMNRQMGELQAMLDRDRPEFIVNFAAQSEVAPSWEHPEHWFRTNTVALAELVNYLRRCSWLARYLHISSPEVYGTCEGEVLESAPLNPSTPYAASKAAADLLLATYHKQFGFPLVTVRATNVYGAGQQLFKVIPRTAIYMKLGRKLHLHGGGAAVKSYIHIRDVSRGELAVLLHGRPGEIYHLSPDRGRSVREVVETMCAMAGRRFDEVADTAPERPGQDAAYVIDSSCARAELGWRPEIDFEQGLREVLEWIDANWSEIEGLPLEYEHKL
jgi:dTDP-glucose 4,6-dehydratase